jgi:hypothetical protein
MVDYSTIGWRCFYQIGIAVFFFDPFICRLIQLSLDLTPMI